MARGTLRLGLLLGAVAVVWGAHEAASGSAAHAADREPSGPLTATVGVLTHTLGTVLGLPVSGTDDGDGVPGDPVGDDRGDESGGESVVDDGDLDLFDRHGRLVDAEDAGVLTGGRAGPTGEFGEVVRRVEQLHGTRQLPTVHGVVELRNEIAQGASLMAERHSAVHAA